VDCKSEIGDGNTLDKTPDCINEVINNGELKKGFANTENTLNKIYVAICGEDVITCHLPQSISQKHDSNTKYDSKGAINQVVRHWIIL